MFVFLAIFIVFLLYINFLMHKNKRAQENLEKQFWDRERSANFTRKKDISNLNYLIITEDKIPQNLTTDAKKSLETLCGQKMLNLSSMSNTDLKLEYGVANLDELSACDDRFSTFERNAAIYAQELSDAGYTDQARQLLEFAFSCLPYTASEIENALHHEELPPARRTVLCVYGAVRGVGGIDSWGTDVEEEYRISAEDNIDYSFTIC